MLPKNHPFRTFKVQISAMPYPYQIKNHNEYNAAYKKSIEDPEGFWGSIAEHFQWRKKWDKVLDWNFKEPSVKWFEGGKLNITENCIDRHLATMGDKPAIIWEPNNPEDRTRIVTWNRLHKRVCQFAQVLTNLGVKKGDRVGIFMPNLPQFVIVYFGILKAGGVVIAVNPTYPVEEILTPVNDAGIEVMFTLSRFYGKVKEVREKSGLKKIIVSNLKEAL